MVRARDADPNNLEVLLALGVGHTNGKRGVLFPSCVCPFLPVEFFIVGVIDELYSAFGLVLSK
jgi:hypothetical protein